MTTTIDKNDTITTNIDQVNDIKTINFINIEDLNKKRTKCEIYTRVMWYFRPVSNFNIWKKSEFYSRTYFDESKSYNSKFIQDYNC